MGPRFGGEFVDDLQEIHLHEALRSAQQKGQRA
jgi:hypothetical protein